MVSMATSKPREICSFFKTPGDKGTHPLTHPFCHRLEKNVNSLFFFFLAVLGIEPRGSLPPTYNPKLFFYF